jgi:predicted nucleotidyltransferase
MNEIDIAKQVIKEEIEGAGLNLEKVILFGSRARGDYSEDSDWDILVVVKNSFTREEKRYLLRSIYRRIARLRDSYEIIIKTAADFERMKDIVGSLSYDANLEGIAI